MPSLMPPRQLHEGEFFGESVRSESHADFRFSDTLYRPQIRVPRHFHERAYFCFLAGGAYRERYGSRWVAYRPRSVAFHPPRDVHEGAIEDGRCLHVEISPRLLERARELGPLPAETVSWHGGPVSWLGWRLFEEFRRSEPGTELALEGIATELLARVVRHAHPDADRPAWIGRATDRVRDSLHRPITLSAIAEDLGVDALRLSRAFRRHHGEAIGDMHRRLRIEEACRRLVVSEASIADIATDLGFSDQSHFTRVFRRHTGTTPARYRRQAS